VRVQSELNKGSTFQVFLPVEDAATPSQLEYGRARQG
jgi:hypothetical protein